jgi:hypothetical protein
MESKTTEAAALAGRLMNEKPDAFKLLKRYLYLLNVMNGGEYPEAEAINSELQKHMDAGDITIAESAEYLDRIEAALPLA